jgi:uncharacterized protein
VLVTGVEIVAAISRRTRMGLISSPDATAAINAFKGHFAAQYRVTLVAPAIVARAMDLAERHGLRGYDAIQLASALAVQSELTTGDVTRLTFLSADNNLNSAAQAEQLLVDNPNTHP